jgi:hypothetical protein
VIKESDIEQSNFDKDALISLILIRLQEQPNSTVAASHGADGTEDCDHRPHRVSLPI